MDEKILVRAEELQTEMHKHACEVTSDRPGVSYQDAINVFLLCKIAELKTTIDNLINEKQ